MKNLNSFITLLIIVNTITNYMSITEANKEELPVRPLVDTDGNEIHAGISTYFFRPVFSRMGGGLATAMMQGFCVYGVAQQKLETQMGEPLVFFPEGFKLGDAVNQSTDLNIGFSVNIGCRPSAIWKVGDEDESAKVNFIMLGGSVGNPGNETVSNWFKIEEYTAGVYKIVHCPSVCDSCNVTCSDIGIYVQNGIRRLVLSEKPFLVQFQKVVLGHNQY